MALISVGTIRKIMRSQHDEYLNKRTKVNLFEIEKNLEKQPNPLQPHILHTIFLYISHLTLFTCTTGLCLTRLAVFPLLAQLGF